MRNPYKHIEGAHQLKRSWVAYMDILGFTAETRLASKNGEQQAHLDKVATAIEQARLRLEKEKKFSLDDRRVTSTAPFAVKIFTDNVVLGYPIADDGESEFGRVIYTIAEYQSQLIDNGFFVRGSLALGDICVGDDIVYGAALIDAYETERDVAVVPRVVLHESAMAAVHSHLTYYASVDGSPHNSAVLIDRDDEAFLDYLQARSEESDDTQEVVLRHRKAIVDNLSRFSSDQHVRSKYEWLAAYHNHFCERHQECSHLSIVQNLDRPELRRLSDVYFRDGHGVRASDGTFVPFRSWRQFKLEGEERR